MIFELTSPAFKNMERIPEKYTCNGQDLSPALQWKGVPEGTRSFVLIMEDPDTPMGTWDHWIVYNIPSHIKQISDGEVDIGTKLANSWGEKKYGGSCPPPNNYHRYFFRLYALNNFIVLKEDSTKADLLEAMKNHIIKKTELIGLYSR